MHIRVADKNLGECNIDVNVPLGKKEEYVIKALCILQIMCMNSKEDKSKFGEFLNIIKEATEKADMLFGGTQQDESELDGTEDFNT
jgi:hypothetical protein